MKKFHLIVIMLIIALAGFLFAAGTIITDLPIGKLTELKGKIIAENSVYFLSTGDKKIQLLIEPANSVPESVLNNSAQDITLKAFINNTVARVVSIQTVNTNIVLYKEIRDSLWLRSDSVYVTSKQMIYTYKVETKGCIGCKLCLNSCPVKAITMEKNKAVINQEKCIKCGQCKNGLKGGYRGCPTKAIKTI